MTLRTWMEENGKSESDIEKATGISQESVSRYLSGKRLPKYEHRELIRRATHGKVADSDWPKEASNED